MEILLLGKVGQLGYELRRTLPYLGPVTALDYPEIDFRNIQDLCLQVKALRPDIIINAVAYTDVDKAEKEVDAARQINAVAPGKLAELARDLHAVFIHYSTDYVFDGMKGASYLETDAPHPLGIYGQSKHEGEQAVAAAGGAFLIFRTAWVYSTRQGGFVTKVLQWARRQEKLLLVTDQISNPTWARALAEITTHILVKAGEDPFEWIAPKTGLYHLAGSGTASRFEWGQAIIELDPKRAEQTVRELHPALTADFPNPAARPLYSALDCTKFGQTFGLQLPDWRHSLALAMEL